MTELWKNGQLTLFLLIFYDSTTLQFSRHFCPKCCTTQARIKTGGKTLVSGTKCFQADWLQVLLCSARRSASFLIMQPKLSTTSNSVATASYEVTFDCTSFSTRSSVDRIVAMNFKCVVSQSLLSCCGLGDLSIMILEIGLDCPDVYSFLTL